jgi:hypothetical protein
MSINIKNKEAERLLSEIKQKTGKGTSQVVLDLLRAEHRRISDDEQRCVAEALERAEGDLSEEEKRRVAEALAWTHRWQAKIAAKRRPDAPPIDEILHWDENGLPI